MNILEEKYQFHRNLFVSRVGEIFSFLHKDDLNGSDQILVNVLCSLSKPQLSLVKGVLEFKYNIKFDDFVSWLNDKSPGNHTRFCKDYAKPSATFRCEMLREAMDGIGCDKGKLNDYFCISNTEEIRQLCDAFSLNSSKSLSKRLESETSGMHLNLLLRLIEKGRGAQQPNDLEAKRVAKQIHELFRDGSGMLGGITPDTEMKLMEIFVDNSALQLQLISRELEKAYPSHGGLEKRINSKCSGFFKDAMIILLKTPIEHFSDRIYETIRSRKVFSGQEEALCEILADIDKIHILELQKSYNQRHSKDLNVDIKSVVKDKLFDVVEVWLDEKDPTGGYEVEVEDALAVTPAERESFVDIPQLMKRMSRAIDFMKAWCAKLDAMVINFATKTQDLRLFFEVLTKRSKGEYQLLDEEFRKRLRTSLASVIEQYVSDHELKQLLHLIIASEPAVDELSLREALRTLKENKSTLSEDDILLQERVIVEVLCARPYARRQQAIDLYRKKSIENHGADTLNEDIQHSLSPNLASMCLKIINFNNPENSTPTSSSAVTEVQSDGQLIVEKLFGHITYGNIEEVTMILMTVGHSQAALINETFQKAYGQTIIENWKTKYEGVNGQAVILSVLQALINPLQFFANRFHEESLQSFSDKSTLTRLFGSNDRPQMKEIVNMYKELHTDNLVSLVTTHVTGHLKVVCAGWLGEEELSPYFNSASPPPAPAAMPANTTVNSPERTLFSRLSMNGSKLSNSKTAEKVGSTNVPTVDTKDSVGTVVASSSAGIPVQHSNLPSESQPVATPDPTPVNLVPIPIPVPVPIPRPVSVSAPIVPIVPVATITQPAQTPPINMSALGLGNTGSSATQPVASLQYAQNTTTTSQVNTLSYSATTATQNTRPVLVYQPSTSAVDTRPTLNYQSSQSNVTVPTINYQTSVGQSVSTQPGGLVYKPGGFTLAQTTATSSSTSTGIQVGVQPGIQLPSAPAAPTAPPLPPVSAPSAPPLPPTNIVHIPHQPPANIVHTQHQPISHHGVHQPSQGTVSYPGAAVTHPQSIAIPQTQTQVPPVFQQGYAVPTGYVPSPGVPQGYPQAPPGSGVQYGQPYNVGHGSNPLVGVAPVSTQGYPGGGYVPQGYGYTPQVTGTVPTATPQNAPVYDQYGRPFNPNGTPPNVSPVVYDQYGRPLQQPHSGAYPYHTGQYR